MKDLKIALVHDYLVAFGGAERVLIALHEIWPDAPVYLAIKDKEKLGDNWQFFQDWDIRTSWFQKVPGASKLISPMRFILPLIWESFDFSDYDLVITSSAWAMPKAIVTKPETTHICYCHTPPRFLYGYPLSRHWMKYWPVRVYSAIINHFLRPYDYISSQRVDHFISNSHEVAGRIKKFYNRKATVIQPPINQPKTGTKEKKSKEKFYFFASRLSSYKHPEIAIKACQQLGRKLYVSGSGPLQEKVEALCAQSEKTEYLGRVSDEKLWQMYRDCQAFLHPIESEDFGMMPLEAASMGTPTIAYYSAGAKETVKEGETGLFFHELTSKSLARAIKKFENQSFSKEICKQWSQQFSKDKFKRRIKEFVSKKLAD
jgi:glycosyltransferase involved in cell wall biosynthesis